MRPKSKTTNKRSNMETLTTENLRGMRCDCDSPECSGEIFFHAGCHPHAGTWTAYDPDTHTLTISCADCGNKIVRILLPTSA